MENERFERLGVRREIEDGRPGFHSLQLRQFGADSGHFLLCHTNGTEVEWLELAGGHKEAFR